jgi:uracil-DNA glycosylase family 4
LQLKGVRITNAVKCLPPANKPLPAEIRACNGYLVAEIQTLAPRVVVALGRIAHDAVLDAVGLARSSCRFGHGAEHRIVPSRPSMSAFSLVDSYHCSRYNTQTRRLTPTMFLEVLGRAQALVGTSGPSSAVR